MKPVKNHKNHKKNHKKSCDKFPYGFKGTPPARQA
jgi:hypothetical protein